MCFQQVTGKQSVFKGKLLKIVLLKRRRKVKMAAYMKCTFCGLRILKHSVTAIVCAAIVCASGGYHTFEEEIDKICEAPIIAGSERVMIIRLIIQLTWMKDYMSWKGVMPEEIKPYVVFEIEEAKKLVGWEKEKDE